MPHFKLLILKKIIPAIFLSVCFKALALEPIHITILADDDFPPYSYAENGELKGIYVDLVNRAADLLRPHYQITLEGVPWQRGLMMMEQGRAFAIIPPYLHEVTRPYIKPYSVILQEEVVVAFCHQGTPLIKALKDSKKLDTAINIGINAGYIVLNETYQQAVNNKNIHVWENKSTEANLMKLITHKIDCYVNDRVAIVQNLKRLQVKLKNTDISSLVEMDEISRKSAHIGYANNNLFPFKADFVEKMNAALLKVKRAQVQSNK